jgi:hypothetical protein
MAEIQSKFHEILSIIEDKLHSGDYLKVSDNLQSIYKTVHKRQQVVPVHIIRKFENVVSEDQQEYDCISFNLTVEEQILVMQNRYIRYYKDLIADLIDEIKDVSDEMKDAVENKQVKWMEIKIQRFDIETAGTGPDKKAHLRILNNEHKVIVRDIKRLKKKLSSLKSILPRLRKNLRDIEKNKKN